MKTRILLVIFTFSNLLVAAQKKTISKDEMIFQNGVLYQKLVDDDLELDKIIDSKDTPVGKKEYALDLKMVILEKAIAAYNELIEKFPKSAFLFRALNNKAFAELSLNRTEAAKVTFKSLLNSDADDAEKGGIGSGIMGEPYANYKNRAAKTFASIYIKDSNYAEAIVYLDLTKKYPYMHFCGNEYAADEIYMTILYAKCFLGLNDNQKAIQILLPKILDNNLADNSEVVDMAYKTLTKTYTKEQLKALFEDAFKKIEVEKIKTKKQDDTRYYITFIDTKIELQSMWYGGLIEPTDIHAAAEKFCKKTTFYKLLEK